MRKSIKAATLASLLLLGSLSSGCYGPFNLTRNLHHWNGSIENKWGREGVFLVLAIIPVYGICMLGDAIIFNSIEFWGGENPIKPSAMGPADEMDQVAAVVGLQYQVNTLPAVH